MKFILLFVFLFSFDALSDCGENESSLSCFIGPSLNPVNLGADGLYHTDYYCSDMVSSYYSPDEKGRLSGEWHNMGPSKTSSCNFYVESERLSLQSQIEHCIYWKKHDIQIPEKYHCERFFDDE